ncbi:hypothetical protein DOY81_000716, partial [Sarcophaga bullata]
MFKLFIVTFLMRSALSLAYTYEAQFENYDIFSPCDNYPDNFLDKFLLMPENITLLPDGSIYAKGDVVLTYDFQPHMKYPLKVEIFKKNRGQWQKTIYTIQRDDLCTAYFNPAEIWHSLAKGVPEEQRKCPLKKGQIFSIDMIIQAVFEINTSNIGGDYLGRIEVGTNAPPDNVFLCAEVPTIWIDIGSSLTRTGSTTTHALDSYEVDPERSMS